MMAPKAAGASGSHCEKIERRRLRVSFARRSCGRTLTPRVAMILSTLTGLLGEGALVLVGKQTRKCTKKALYLLSETQS